MRKAAHNRSFDGVPNDCIVPNIFECVVHVFLVLAIGPHYLKKKQVSVSLHMLSCLFPLPIIIYFLVKAMFKNKFGAVVIETKKEQGIGKIPELRIRNVKRRY